MAKYIDKGRLIFCMNDWMLQNAPIEAGDDTTRADIILDAIKMVEDSPAADVVPVKHGRWIDGYKRQTCSVCFFRGMKSWKWCPVCGAKMDAKEGDGDDADGNA